jgi:hypothetical protein
VAGTKDNHSTWPEGDRLLLHEVLALVTKYCRSTRAAEQLFYRYAKRRHFTRCSWNDDSRGIPISSWGTSRPNLGFFVVVDWETSSVTYARLGPEKATRYLDTLTLEEELEKLLPDDRIIQIQMARISRREVLSMLRKAGFSVDEPDDRGATPAEQSAPQLAEPLRAQPAPAQARQWRRSDGKKWLGEKIKQCLLPTEPRQKAAWCRVRYGEMGKDFGEELPWSDSDTLRRRLDELLRETRQKS